MLTFRNTVFSETLAYKIQTPGNYPQESIQHSEHGESLKIKKKYVFIKIITITQLRTNAHTKKSDRSTNTAIRTLSSLTDFYLHIRPSTFAVSFLIL